jgi:hypothetical protein
LSVRNSESPPTSPNTRSSNKGKSESKKNTETKKVTEVKKVNNEVNKKVNEIKKSNEVKKAVMTTAQMRELVGELLQKISTPERLTILGFGSRAIDDVLHDSISSSGRKPCDANLPVAERLRKNVDILLEWTIPPQFMTKFRKEKRTTEELLEELTS